MGARILIIEDNAGNLDLMTYILTAFGHEVTVAEDGTRGIAAAAATRPELIICDIQLPDMDGFTVALRLRSDPSVGSIPLIAVTALAMMGDRERVLAAGFDGYFSKPIDPETFVSEIEAFLGPRYQSSPQPIASASAGVSPKTIEPQFTILVVDNLQVNLDLARGILEPSGYLVRTATGIPDALTSLRKQSCDLILSDVCMGGHSGYDLLRMVRADPQHRDLPFLLITSTMMDEADRKRGLELGADRFLWRPIEPELLLSEIHHCLHLKGPSNSWRPS